MFCVTHWQLNSQLLAKVFIFLVLNCCALCHGCVTACAPGQQQYPARSNPADGHLLPAGYLPWRGKAADFSTNYPLKMLFYMLKLFTQNSVCCDAFGFFSLFCSRPLLNGEKQATKKWQSMRTSNSCCRLHWMTLKRSYRHASPCHATLTLSTEAPRLASCSQRSTHRRPTTTSMPGDRYGIKIYCFICICF